MGLWVSRTQVVNRLRDDDWTFQRKGERVEIYRKRGTTLRVDVPLRDLLPEVTVRTIFRHAKLTPDQVEDFLKHCIKS